MRRTPTIEGNKKGAEVTGNALLGGGAARLRLRAHMGAFGAIGLIGGGHLQTPKQTRTSIHFV